MKKKKQKIEQVAKGCRHCHEPWDRYTAPWEVIFEICTKCLIDRTVYVAKIYDIFENGKCCMCGESLADKVLPKWLRRHYLCMECMIGIPQFISSAAYIAKKTKPTGNQTHENQDAS